MNKKIYNSDGIRIGWIGDVPPLTPGGVLFLIAVGIALICCTITFLTEYWVFWGITVIVLYSSVIMVKKCFKIDPDSVHWAIKLILVIASTAIIMLLANYFIFDGFYHTWIPVLSNDVTEFSEVACWISCFVLSLVFSIGAVLIFNHSPKEKC